MIKSVYTNIAIKMSDIQNRANFLKKTEIKQTK